MDPAIIIRQGTNGQKTGILSESSGQNISNIYFRRLAKSCFFLRVVCSILYAQFVLICEKLKESL